MQRLAEFAQYRKSPAKEQLEFYPALTDMLARCSREYLLDNHNDCIFQSYRAKTTYAAEVRAAENPYSNFLGLSTNRIAVIAARFALLYSTVSDVQSKNQVVTLAAFSILGHRHVRLPLWRPYICEEATKARELCYIGKDKDNEAYYDFSKAGFFFKGYLGLAGFALLISGSPHYTYRYGSVVIQPEPGDVVIDCGGYDGFESFLFASLVGASGQVHVMDMNEYPRYFKHTELNPELAKIIAKHKVAVWSTSGETLYFEDNGPSSKLVGKTKKTIAIPTITLDDLVKSKGLNRVNFLKMDIEGAELNALLGAEETIRKHRPKLAISVYHKIDNDRPDYVRIVNYCSSLNLGYKFYFSHFSFGTSESVLYAVSTS